MTLSCLCSGAKCKTYSSYSAPTSCLDIRTRSVRTGKLLFLLSISLSLPSISTEAGEYARLSVFSYEVSEKSLFFLSPVPSQRLSFLLYVMLLGLRFGSLLHVILLAALWQSAVDLMFSCMVRFQCFENQMSKQPVIVKIAGTSYNWSIFGRKKESRSIFCQF